MRIMLVFCLLILGITGFSQDKGVIAGPMLGQVEIRTASVWAEVTPGSVARIWYWKKGQPSTIRQIQVTTNKQDWYAPVKFDLVSLDMNTTYEYAITTTPTKPAKASASFTTKDLWQWRKPAPDFSFLAGSCLYFNDPAYDRPGKPYGQDSTILLSMAKEKAAFMVWLGDNWYTREADYFSRWGLWYRANHYRSQPVLQPFLRSTSHFAIWDDHDYGPDNSNKSFSLKDESRKVFENYWMNPSYGEDGKGIYTVVSYGDVDVFLMDDRSFRTADEIDSAYNGKRNEHKRMWGDKQLEWLSNALAASPAKFKVIASGSQFINKLSRFDCLTLYPVDFDAFMNILDKQKVEGVLLLSGDRHHSEIISYPRENGYTLYDITASSITAGVSKAGGVEKDHPMRVKNTLLEENNYARFSVSGGKNDRIMKVEFLNRAGEVKVSWSVHENELKYKK